MSVEYKYWINDKGEIKRWEMGIIHLEAFPVYDVNGYPMCKALVYFDKDGILHYFNMEKHKNKKVKKYKLFDTPNDAEAFRIINEKK